MFVLGLRHGLDPDHIACIDGLTWSTLEHNHKLAPWVGTLFALGHGLPVTGIAVGVNQLSRYIHVSAQLSDTNRDACDEQGMTLLLIHI